MQVYYDKDADLEIIKNKKVVLKRAIQPSFNFLNEKLRNSK